MEQVSQISLRNKRRPGFSSVDNEVFCCYQAIIGSDATWIYVQLTHQVQQQGFKPSVTFALREMAAWSGRSKDTVQRSLAILELVGLIAVRRAMKSKATYDLLDVKELVLLHGAVYEPRSASYALPDAKIQSLTAAVKDLRAQLGRKRSAASTGNVSRVYQSVAQSDRFDSGNLFLSVAQSDRSVALEDASVAPEGHATSYRKKEKIEEKNNIPLPPSQAKGECGQGEAVYAWSQDPEKAVDEVMRKCGFTNVRLKKVIRSQMQLDLDDGCVARDVAERMIAAWKSYVIQDVNLRAKWGPRNFFGEGHWRDHRSWHWDATELNRNSNSRVGMR